MLLTRRGMGVTYGPTDAQLGITPGSTSAAVCAPNDMSCVLGIASNVATSPVIGAVPVGSVFPSGSLPDQVQTCVNTGGPLTDCVAAVLSTNTAGLPSWVLPVGLGLLGILLIKAMSR